MPLQDEYQVRLDAFCGPLDLLLFLIRQAEVDVNDIPIAEITEQYLGFVGQVDEIDIEAAGEFLVMAATLMEIKSRALTPPVPQESPQGLDADDSPLAVTGIGTESDPRLELVQQLLEYQRFRISSELLQEHREAFLSRYAARPHRLTDVEPSAREPVLELDDAHVFDLFEAYQRIVASIDFTRLGDHHIEIDEKPAAVYQEELLERIRDATDNRISLQAAFAQSSRTERVGLFLAMLELVRLRQIRVWQEELESEIIVELSDPE